MNSLDILITSTQYFYKKNIGARQAGFVSGLHDFMLFFHFWWTAHATFDKKF